ncbi:MAG: DUF1460 domain-containing protein [Candidatus Marinimicrobia bacterium]|nr:DUF1460 domain-containing protein [Candidatus Neomarinimicrobiota bacterium]
MRVLKTFSLLCLTVFAFSCKGNVSDKDWIAHLPKPWTLSQEQMDEILPLFQERFPEFQSRLKYFALWRVGTPYEIFKLGEEVEPDPDPIIRYDLSDCTGHNLTSLAAVRSSSWAEAKDNMINIHYKADSSGVKQPTYASRWHYTLDRITANPNTVDITQTLLPRDQLDSVKITLNKKDTGEEFLELNWDREMVAYYIPNDQITQSLLDKLPQIVGVAFVKPAYFKMGIVMGHEGMIIDGKYLVHASQSAGKTVKLDFLKYYFPKKGAFFGGIMIFEFKENG